MLDVHPPEHAAHTWRDFFIHIATIVVGLLIAIGLEQTVELLHRAHEVRETRERIRQELKTDRRMVNQNRHALQQETVRWAQYGTVLAHPDVTADQVAAMSFSWELLLEPTSAWENARQSNVFSYIPPDENERVAYLYRLLAENYNTSDHYIDDVRTADAIVQRVRTMHALDPADRERLLVLVDQLRSRAQNQLDIYNYLAEALARWLDHGQGMDG